MQHDSPSRERHPIRTPSGLDETDPSKFPESPPLIMPGDAEDVSQEIAQLGVEGRPADPKTGPGAIRLGLAGLCAVLMIAAVLVALSIDWPTGLAVFGIGCLGLLFNPVIGAVLMRARDRQEIVDEQGQGRRRTGLRG